MGDRSDRVRKKKAIAEINKSAATKVRTRIYQDILTLLNIAERLAMDFSSRADRYGLEWFALARQIKTQYAEDVAQIVPGLKEMVMSKAGTQGLPTGLYRRLLEFNEQCSEFMDWMRRPTDEIPVAEGEDSPFMQVCRRFKKNCSDMQQEICIYENERPKGEESFFG